MFGLFAKSALYAALFFFSAAETFNRKVRVHQRGSVAYVASAEEHGWRNVGAGRAHYFVLALGRDQ